MSARLPYKVKVSIPDLQQGQIFTLVGVTQSYIIVEKDNGAKFNVLLNIDFKSYLRPMSSMTEEERKEYEGFIIHREHVNAWGQEWDIDCFSFDNSPRLIDCLNAHHFDYRGLITKGLALEAPEGMYKMEEEQKNDNI